MQKLCGAMLVALTLYAQAQAPAGGGQAGWDKITGPQGAWVYIVVGGYDKIGPRLENAAGKLGADALEAVKEIPTQIREGAGNSQGIPNDAVDLSRPFAVAVYNPMAGQSPAVVIPVKSDLVKDKKLINGYLLACENDMLASRLTSALETAGAGAVEAPAGAIRVYVDVGTVFQLFGPLVQMQLAAGMGQAGAGSAQEKQAAMAAVDTMFNLLGQVKHVVIDLDVGQDNLVLDTQLAAKDGTDMAQLFGTQSGGTGLGAIMPSRSFAMSGKLAGIGPFTLKLVERLLGKALTNPADATFVRERLTKLIGGMGDEFAGTLDFTPDGMVVEQVVAFKGSLEDIREYYKMLSSDKAPAGVRALMSGGMGTGAYSVQENVRQSGGVPVDKFKTVIDASKLDPQVATQMKTMFGEGGLEGEYALANGKLLVTMGGKDCAQRMDQLIAKSKDAGAAGREPVAFNLDLIKFVENVARGMGMNVAPSTDAAAPVAGTAKFSGATATTSLVVPIDTIAKVKAFAEKMEAGGGAPPPPVAPQPVETPAPTPEK